MNPEAKDFKKKSDEAIENPGLQQALKKLTLNLGKMRRESLERYPEFPEVQTKTIAHKEHVLANLDLYLEQLEKNVEAAGGVVHWCSEYDDAKEAIAKICERRQAKVVVKGKSMISEEIGLNDHLESQGITVVETDVGEHILQLAGERPSHIVGPAWHKPVDEVSDLFQIKHRRYGHTERKEDAEDLVRQACDVLREHYFEADVGITGANILIASTGTAVIVTNEGNGDLSQQVPPVHIVVTTFDRVVGTPEDAMGVLRLLGRSASGQDLTAYTTFATGARQQGDLDGPEEFHLVLLDAGRSRLLGSPKQDLLRCIRCAACINHCPIYAAVGGHSYGWVYPGPIGAALVPELIGLENATDLPRATSICGRCDEVCPMKIPLTSLKRDLRNELFDRELIGRVERFALRAWSFVARRPALYHRLTSLMAGILGRLGRAKGSFSKLPFASGWTSIRDLPAPATKTFQQQWKERKRP
jgi:L-lactate dehydrogenase complex protein LldF